MKKWSGCPINLAVAIQCVIKIQTCKSVLFPDTNTHRLRVPLRLDEWSKFHRAIIQWEYPRYWVVVLAIALGCLLKRFLIPRSLYLKLQEQGRREDEMLLWNELDYAGKYRSWQKGYCDAPMIHGSYISLCMIGFCQVEWAHTCLCNQQRSYC